MGPFLGPKIDFLTPNPILISGIWGSKSAIFDGCEHEIGGLGAPFLMAVNMKIGVPGALFWLILSSKMVIFDGF